MTHSPRAAFRHRFQLRTAPRGSGLREYLKVSFGNFRTTLRVSSIVPSSQTITSMETLAVCAMMLVSVSDRSAGLS